MFPCPEYSLPVSNYTLTFQPAFSLLSSPLVSSVAACLSFPVANGQFNFYSLESCLLLVEFHFSRLTFSYDLQQVCSFLTCTCCLLCVFAAHENCAAQRIIMNSSHSWASPCTIYTDSWHWALLIFHSPVFFQSSLSLSFQLAPTNICRAHYRYESLLCLYTQQVLCIYCNTC